MARLSTHVLDSARGTPAKGVTVELHRLQSGERQHLNTMITNADGRTDAPFQVNTGIHELTFHAGDYLRSTGAKLSEPPFLDQIVVRFGIADPNTSYHVPLLLSPFGYSTYRGIVMQPYLAEARQAIERCRQLAAHSEEPGFTTRTFLSEPMRSVHEDLRGWMEQAGINVHVDAAGNLRGYYEGAKLEAPRLVIGSHLDTVPDAGAFDGILGVVLGVGLVEVLGGRRLGIAIEVVGFSEEEGVRFGVPFIGSRAMVGNIDDDLLAKRDTQGISVSEAIRAFGLNPSVISDACVTDETLGYLEFHIEQGPVLESLGLPLGVVTAIAGQSRLEVMFDGSANHAGTTPMNLRRDALAGAAEWMGSVEREAHATPGLVATVGRIEARPGAGNVIAGTVSMSLDVRHTGDDVRARTAKRLLDCAQQIAGRRGLVVSSKLHLDQAAVAMDVGLVATLAHSVGECGYEKYRMHSGAGHDAMIMAARMPAAMLFLRSPGGISHHPNEAVLAEDVAAALTVGLHFLDQLERAHG